MQCHLSCAGVGNQSGIGFAYENLFVFPDSLQLALSFFVRRVFKFKRKVVQVEENVTLPWLGFAFDDLPCALVLIDAVNQGPKYLARPPVSILKGVDGTLKAEPVNIGVQIGREFGKFGSFRIEFGCIEENANKTGASFGFLLGKQRLNCGGRRIARAANVKSVPCAHKLGGFFSFGGDAARRNKASLFNNTRNNGLNHIPQERDQMTLP